jgi:NarL family two-component system sensor histidine kinase YdfH
MIAAFGVLILFSLTLAIAVQQGCQLSENSINLLAALVLLVVGLLFVSGFFVLYVRLAGMHADLEAAYDGLAAANKRIEALTRNMERQRIARELHDTLAQGLVGVILQLGAVQARARGKQDKELQEILDQILASARDALASARSAIDELRTAPSPSEELLKAAQEKVSRFTAVAGIPCHTDPNLLSQVSPKQAEQFIRMIREGLANVARHARAQRA